MEIGRSQEVSLAGLDGCDHFRHLICKRLSSQSPSVPPPVRSAQCLPSPLPATAMLDTPLQCPTPPEWDSSPSGPTVGRGPSWLGR
jgi:hypothetical protein